MKDKRAEDWNPNDLIAFVDKIAALHDKGLMPFALHLPGGNEEQLIDIFSEINSDDYVLSTHRNMYHALLHGLPENEIEDKLLNARSMFMFDRKRNFYVSAIIGGTPGIAVGIAWALKQKKSHQKVYCFVGDGIEDTGHFYEAVRYVDGFNLPCVFIIEDDGMAVESSKKNRWNTDKNWGWPDCVRRYNYKKTRPHIRTGNFADISNMKKVMKSDIEYFPEIHYPDYRQQNHSTDLSYKDAIKFSMQRLGASGHVFIGYSILPGNAAGSLDEVPDSQKIETPVAENLMIGLAIGMSFEGFKPVVYFERHDFMLVAADAIGNHVDKIERISHGEYSAPIILKTVVDDGGLFYSGPTHSQDFTQVFKKMVNFPVIDTHNASEVLSAYDYAEKCNHPVMIVEHKKYL
jgi:Dehydrogenase E1 component/Transketolase, pyrimidine binding domain